MIISLQYRFIFVANLKAASTSIEAALRSYGDIVISQSEFGKHLPYCDIQQRFGWVFDLISEKEFFKFAVIRDPVSYMKSLYLSHTDEKFLSSSNLFTGNMSFKDFLEIWVTNNQDQVVPQIQRFVDKNGNYALDFLIKYEELFTGLAHVIKYIGLNNNIHLPMENISPTKHVELDEKDIEVIRNIFAEDYNALSFYKQSNCHLIKNNASVN